MSFLQFEQKRFLIFGVANKKSVAWHIAKFLREENAETAFVVRDEKTREQVMKLFPDSEIFICDVENDEQIAQLRADVEQRFDRFDGLVHSIAFADYGDGLRPFHETNKKAFLQAMDISCFSLIAISRAFADLLDRNASVVTISISTTTMASENYGYMAPIKAALDSAIVFLAKSFSNFSNVRFNAVAPSLLKTSASAGIPGYLDSYLFAEQVIPRKSALTTEEAAAAAVFLLSPRSSGINAQKIIVDAGMSINYFDKTIIQKTVNGK
ncbi:MAG: SDR family oxidoreductase [Planctomycetaceae bacterium]|jgi:enoyl-[acyl-carrier protein] reductase I|nr:SDR family oxidoreductase [Planctomycetaceae bacterium]